ncbi:hypothetical protein NST74_06380 [Paenibacillus sp. FSL F4-0125]|uniref:hypothetical protein n=1 Tax=Paenibacillus sp. FSL F4-0125 TaxID=2954730 RepID=UPI0030FA5A4F
MKFPPAAKSNRWFLWMAVYGVSLWLLFIVHRFVMMAHSLDITLLLRFALFSIIVSGIVNVLGWFGARLLWLITTTGIIIGSVIMLSYTYREMSGWEDLAGFLAFFFFTCGGFALGLLAESIRLLVKHWPKA